MLACVPPRFCSATTCSSPAGCRHLPEAQASISSTRDSMTPRVVPTPEVVESGRGRDVQDNIQVPPNKGAEDPHDHPIVNALQRGLRCREGPEQNLLVPHWSDVQWSGENQVPCMHPVL